MFSLMNTFLSEIQLTSCGDVLHVDLSKAGNAQRQAGFFADTGIIRMLEAAEYDDVDKVSPFLGTIMDRCCGRVDEAPVATLFTK